MKNPLIKTIRYIVKANNSVTESIMSLPTADLWAERLDDIGRKIQAIQEEMETALWNGE
jgi:hypothetical protein